MNIIDVIRKHIKTQQELELEDLREKELALRKLHTCIWPPQHAHMCLADGMPYPCPTIRILDGLNQNEAPAETE